MAFGIECDNGWYDLLYKLCKDIESASPPEDFRFAQIKEKFGGLRVYYDSGNEAIHDLVNAAERQSYTICEGCGTSESVTSEGSWILTLCPSCRGKR